MWIDQCAAEEGGLRSIPFSAIYIHWPSSPYNQRKNKVQSAKFTTGRRKEEGAPNTWWAPRKYIFILSVPTESRQITDPRSLGTANSRSEEKREERILELGLMIDSLPNPQDRVEKELELLLVHQALFTVTSSFMPAAQWPTWVQM